MDNLADIEKRILAQTHSRQIESLKDLLRAYPDGEKIVERLGQYPEYDMYTVYASLLFDTLPPDVTPEQRLVAKRRMFGFIYGRT